MRLPSDPEPPTLRDEAAELLFDAYLDQALGGDIEDPIVFCARHEIAPGDVRERIVALHRAVGADDGDARARPLQAEAGLPFERLGEFRLIRRLGSGGMGMVFLAEQESLSRLVALKLIRPEMRGAPRARERFRREAAALARLRHPNIVSVLAVGEDHGAEFLVMELVPGRGLDAILEDVATGREDVPLPTRIGWIADLARALQHAHDNGLVHRDVKPSNVRIMDDGRPLLLDFGLARDLEGAGASITGGFVGSLAYASPEQLRGDTHPADSRSDTYALGVTLYQALVGSVPFEGGSVDAVLHRILTQEPRFPAGLSPPLPRDLQLVVLTALEKDRESRYATAAALADDLQAVLDLRPVSARPPGVGRRLQQWTRRHPAAAAALLTGLLAVASIVWVVGDQKLDQRLRSEASARDALSQARIELSSLREGLARTGEMESRLLVMQRELEGRYIDPDEAHLLDAMEDQLRTILRDRERSFHVVLDLVARAEQLHPGIGGTEALRGDLYFERWRAATAEGDRATVDFYRDKVLEHDAEGHHTEALFGWISSRIETVPAAAEVRLYKRTLLSNVVAGGEPRLVNVPIEGWPTGADPSQWALVVRADVGPLRRGDLIVEVAGTPIRGAIFNLRATATVPVCARLVSIDEEAVHDPYEVASADGRSGPHDYAFAWDGGGLVVQADGLDALGVVVADARGLAQRGGVPARVFTGGRFVELELPVGLSLRTTAAPLYLGAPLGGRDVRTDRAQHVLHLRLPGYEDRRLSWLYQDDGQPVLRLHPEGTSPSGFSYLSRIGNERVDAFWMMEREVTCAEYLVFLNDPATRAEMDAAEVLVRAPRNPQTTPAGGHWQRDEDGLYVLPDDWSPDWPVLGVSFDDASAFALWRTKQARAQGRRWHFALPDADQWLLAGDTGDYVWGSRFRPHWTKSNYSRRTPVPEEVLSFPIDESSLGVFDLAGSVSEWIDSSWLEGSDMHSLGGGSWANADPALFGVYPAHGAESDQPMDTYGFRLVMTIDEEEH